MIYADNAATTKLDKRALEAMLPYLSEEYGNPSSQYSLAIRSRKAIAEARERISLLIGADADEIFFTSGGTESDNWAIKGTALANQSRGKHIITSLIEHHAVLRPCQGLEKQGFKVTYLSVDKLGRVSPTSVKEALMDSTTLISIMLANNEIGTLQNVKEIAQTKPIGTIFHSDAVQVVGHISIDVQDLGVDMLSASAHKFNGPKGIGFLYKKKGLQIDNFMVGGGQESHNRAGTENVVGIVGMAVALENNIEAIKETTLKLCKLTGHTMALIDAMLPDAIINGDRNERLPGNVNVSLKNVEAESLLHLLDLRGICISSGSACNSREIEISHVIKAIGVPAEYANGTLRITYSAENTIEDATSIVMAIKDCYDRIQSARYL